MEIGSKLKESRQNANLTQEQAAEALNISRQTISNWENNKTYPDIISVIKLSDLYAISLDHLLKGEPMSDYLEYVEESTNVVKSKDRLRKIIQVGVYLVIWTACILFFWTGMDPGAAFEYSFVVMWLILPVVSMVVSFFIGKDNSWGRLKWLMLLFFAVMYMLSQYATFSMANMLSFRHFNLPEFGMLGPGAAFALVGLAMGSLVEWQTRRKKK